MQDFWRRFKRNRAAVFGLTILMAIVCLALAAPLIYTQSPFRVVGKPFLPPFGEYLLGTDVLGRDVLAGIVHGARVSLLIGILATVVAVFTGTLVGGISGYYGGFVDDLLMRITEFFQTIPSFIFAILLVAILAPSIGSIIIAVGVVSWPPIARLVRGEFMTMRNREFVQACIVMGMGDLRVIFQQILPNTISPDHRYGIADGRQRHPDRIRPFFSGAGGPEHYELGVHGRGRENPFANCLVAMCDSRYRHPACRSGY
ncbi:MAG: ABC transporter permease [Desulfosudis oleivorans]|nr:ABC transporter permease [Desulfosudis oleivorans]